MREREEAAKLFSLLRRRIDPTSPITDSVTPTTMELVSLKQTTRLLTAERDARYFADLYLREVADGRRRRRALEATIAALRAQLRDEVRGARDG
jgi:hypothetical protein